MLWKRETGRLNGTYSRPTKPTVNQVIIDKYRDLGGVELVLYTRIGVNIEPLTGEELARRAISSVKVKSVREGKDGISYLLRAKASGVETPLTAAYERAILDLTGATTLEEAITIARASWPS